MRKTRLHDPAGHDPTEPSPSRRSSGSAAGGETPPPTGSTGSRSHAAHAARARRSRVRNRLLVGVLLTGIAVLTAGVPAVHAGYQQLTAVQDLVADAQLGRRALTFAHTLADERDALVAATEAGGGSGGSPLSEEDRDRADEQAAELEPDLPEGLRDSLDALPDIRQRALEGEADPTRTHNAYTGIIEDLRLTLLTASGTVPGQAVDPTASALPDLARAADASAASHGLLLAGTAEATADPERNAALTRLAQRQANREAAAVGSFVATADEAALDAYERAVGGASGSEVAEEYLNQLTHGEGALAPEDAEARENLDRALAARAEAQRTVLSSLATEQLQSLNDQRSDELLSLQLRVGLLVAALVLALGVSVRTARSLTRPLAAVRLGSRRVAADPAGQQPVRYTGRDDEFAEVVASVNALHARAVELHQRATEIERDSGGLRAERDRLLSEHGELSNQLTALHGAVHGMFAHHAQRLLGLVGEQLSVIERLEEHETDPDHLAVLFTLDHLAARMRRHGENLLLLAGADSSTRATEPMPLIDVLRAAVSEIERYELVEISPPPAVGVVGSAARDLSHLLAELLDNATAFSPEGARVRLSGRWLEGGLTLLVEDEGMGVSDARLAVLNARLADPITPPPGAEGGHGHGHAGAPAVGAAGIGMGLYTVARLAARHGLHAALRARPSGGTAAEIVVSATLLTEMQGLPGMGEVPGAYPPPTPAPARPVLPTRTPGAQASPLGTPLAPPNPVAPASPLAPPSPVTPASPVAPAEHGHGEHARPEHGHTEHAHAADSVPAPYAFTDSGLPMRTTGAIPVVPNQAVPPAEASQATPRVDAEELRRRLGGFQRGAREGHRDAARTAGSATAEDEEAPS
ncbi:sensor histidine kinase [Streptomyces sp. 4N509B]|uniref:sensor histidine kinase n=1 Tax=Streptomyces sp. 4N509B TaxID=3457413 RepID=UPI003FD44278